MKSIITDKKEVETTNLGEFGKLQGVLSQESVYDFMEFEELLSKEQRVSLNGQLLLEDKKAQALYIEKTQLSPYVEEMTEDATILVFLSNEKHLEAKKAFLKFATEK